MNEKKKDLSAKKLKLYFYTIFGNFFAWGIDKSEMRDMLTVLTQLIQLERHSRILERKE